MIELEVLFKSGQGLLLALEDRESALLFMKHALDARTQHLPGLFHLSTSTDEILIDLGDITLIRFKKEQIPLLGTKLRLNEAPRTERTASATPTEAESPPAAAESKAEASASEPTPRPESPLHRAEARLQQAEERRRARSTAQIFTGSPRN